MFGACHCLATLLTYSCEPMLWFIQVYVERNLHANHVCVPVLPSVRHPSSLAELHSTQPLIQRLFRPCSRQHRPPWWCGVRPPRWHGVGPRCLLDATPGRPRYVRRGMLPSTSTTLPLSSVQGQERRCDGRAEVVQQWVVYGRRCGRQYETHLRLSSSSLSSLIFQQKQTTCKTH